MSKLIGKLAGFFRSRTRVGMDKAGNKYFRRFENVDGVMKEKRWVIFKAEEDPITIPVEWISWLNGQRKNAPTPEEMTELEARRERVRINVENLKKEEERNSKLSKSQQVTLGEAGGPNLKSFIQQFPGTSCDQERGTASEGLADAPDDTTDEIRTSEPTGSGQSFKPGTWHPPT